MQDVNQVETAAVVIDDPVKPVTADILNEEVGPNDIITQFKPGDLIKLRKKSDGKLSSIVTNGEYVRLASNRSYYIPISNKTLRKNDLNVIRAESKIGEEMIILNVEYGFACIRPLFNNLLITNNMKLGICI